MLTSATTTQFPKRTVRRTQNNSAHAKVLIGVMLWPLTRVTHSEVYKNNKYHDIIQNDKRARVHYVYWGSHPSDHARK